MSNGLHGEVDCLTHAEISGWVAPVPEPGKVSLLLNGACVAETRAFANRYGGTEARPRFLFNLKQLWTYVSAGDALTVAVADRPLPFAPGVKRISRFARGEKPAAELMEALQAGMIFDNRGKLQRRRDENLKWQERALALYGLVRRVVAERCVLDVFLIGGTLLGAIRAQGFLPHDFDFDCAVLLPEPEAEAMRARFLAVCRVLSETGCELLVRKSHVKLRHPSTGGVQIDLFMTGFDDDRFAMPWGTAGERRLMRNEMRPARAITLAGHEVLVPDPPDAVLAVLYGEDWRVPDPSWNWRKNKRRAFTALELTEAEMDSITAALEARGVHSC